jgi:hypothetical protein
LYGKKQENIDKADIYAFNWFGLYYVRVKPKNGNMANTGTFAICFN